MCQKAQRSGCIRVDFYMKPENLPPKSVYSGKANMTFNIKLIRIALVKEALTSLSSSVVAVLGSPGLTVGDATMKLSSLVSMGMRKFWTSRGLVVALIISS